MISHNADDWGEGVAESSAECREIIALAFEAALEPAGRATLLDRMKKFLHADAIVWLAGNAKDPARPSQLLQSGLGAAKMGDYGRLGWSSPLASGMSRARPCEPLTNRMLVAPGELERSDFYQDWVRPNNVGGTGLIAMLAPLTGPTVIISAMRETSARVQFDDDDSIARYRLLLPYIARAASFNERMDRLAEHARAAAEIPHAALDVFTVAALCLDARLSILWMNRAAGGLLARGSGLSAVAGAGIAAETAAETERLHNVLRCAARGSGGAIQLHRSSGEAALSLIAMPYRHGGKMAHHLPSGRAPRIMAFVFDPADGLDAPQWLLQQRLRSLFGLTVTEALIGIRIAQGAGIPAVARAMRLEPSTVRSHAKQVFAKTGVHSQAELARVVTRLGLVGE